MKNPLWKQDNAVDQLTTIRGALEGTIYNLEQGIYTPKVFAEKVQPLLQQMAELEPYLSGQQPWYDDDVDLVDFVRKVESHKFGSVVISTHRSIVF